MATAIRSTMIADRLQTHATDNIMIPSYNRNTTIYKKYKNIIVYGTTNLFV
jgi:hypothetical protein